MSTEAAARLDSDVVQIRNAYPRNIGNLLNYSPPPKSLGAHVSASCLDKRADAFLKLFGRGASPLCAIGVPL